LASEWTTEIEGEATHGAGTAAVYEAVREVVPPLTEDRPLSEEIDRAAALVESGVIDDAVERALGERLE
jgi:histidine ammonia-lyase